MSVIWFQKTVVAVFFSLLVLLCQRGALADPVVTPYTQAQLVSEVSAFKPGEPFWVALRAATTRRLAYLLGATQAIPAWPLRSTGTCRRG